jgi:sec-independent protein translocase protein TatA
MALIGWPELLLIVFILLLLFGATRIKGLTRALGEGVREFRKATSESPEKEEENESIIEAAKKMGIETEGKDIKQILKEMNEKVT